MVRGIRYEGMRRDRVCVEKDHVCGMVRRREKEGREGGMLRASGERINQMG